MRHALLLALLLGLSSPSLFAERSSEVEKALRYLNGDGVKRDTRRAIRLIRNAARKGDGDAEYLYGWVHLVGRGVKRSPRKAEPWLRKAARKDHRHAQQYLARLLARSRDPADRREARHWKKASEATREPKPEVIPPTSEEQKALLPDLFRRFESIKTLYAGKLLADLVAHAESGKAYQQFQLAYYHQVGHGVEKDLTRARELFLLAWKNGYEPGLAAYHGLAEDPVEAMETK